MMEIHIYNSGPFILYELLPFYLVSGGFIDRKRNLIGVRAQSTPLRHWILFTEIAQLAKQTRVHVLNTLT